MRFHLDEHISNQIAAGLRRRNIDVTTAADVGMTGSVDSDHLEFAALADRVVVTQDEDFLRLHAEGAPHAGIAYCRQGSKSVGEMLRSLLLIHEFLTPAEMTGRIEFL